MAVLHFIKFFSAIPALFTVDSLTGDESIAKMDEPTYISDRELLVVAQQLESSIVCVY